MRSNAVPRSASAPLEDSTGASHVVDGGVRVEMAKIELTPISKSVQATKPAAVPVVAVAVPFQSNRSIAVSRARCLCDGHFVANLRPMGAASRKSRKNLFFTRSRGGRGEENKQNFLRGLRDSA